MTRTLALALTLLALTNCTAASLTLDTCTPTRENGRALTNGEWNLIIAFASDDQQQFSPEGVTYKGTFRTWCQLRDHDVYSTAYWLFVEDIDNIIETAMFFCSIDPDTVEVTC